MFSLIFFISLEEKLLPKWGNHHVCMLEPVFRTKKAKKKQKQKKANYKEPRIIPFFSKIV